MIFIAKAKMKRELTLFDVTLLVVGSVIGSDIFVASGLTANLMGPGSLIVWVIAAVFAAHHFMDKKLSVARGV